MVSKVVFHIGDQKTGSTAIQSVLMRNNWSSDGPSVAYMSEMNSRGLSKALFKKGRKKFVESRFTSLVKKIDRCEAEIAVVSDEAFERVDPNVLAEAINTYMPQYRDMVHVVAYVRPHVERLRASYTQLVKMGLITTTPEPFINKACASGRYIYTPRFTAWRDRFGDRFSLRPMIRSELVGNDVVRDFFHTLLGGAAFEYTEVAASNTGLPFSDLVMLRAFHGMKRKKGYPVEKNVRGKAAWHLSRSLEKTPAENAEKLAFSQQQIDRIVARHRDDAGQMDQAFFDKPLMGPALSAALKKTGHPSLSYEMSDHFDADGQRLALLWGQLTDDLMARDPDEWGGYFRKLWVADIVGQKVEAKGKKKGKGKR
jgi:hypothetical protein